MPLRTKLLIFGVVLFLLFTGLSVGTYLSLFQATHRADSAREQLAKLSLVEALEKNCACLTEAPDDLTCERCRRLLSDLREQDWDPEGWQRLTRIQALARPLYAGGSLGRLEELNEAVADLKSLLLDGIRADLRKTDAPTRERALRLLVTSCLLAVGGSATFAWLANRLVRERRALEGRVRRSEKLAALGTLAAGIAHEINNPLATISMSAEALSNRVPEGSADVGYCQAIIDEAQRCRNIIGDLSDLARGGSVDRGPVDARDLTEEAVRIVQRNRSLPEAKLDTDVPADLPLISADRGKLLQVLVNLIQNGVEAAGSGGTVRLAARRVNGRLSLAVTDDGKGISPRLMDRIFEPFYTDKARGVGLGLTLCHRIAELHGGELTASSPGPGAGSTFTLLLPIEAKDGA